MLLSKIACWLIAVKLAYKAKKLYVLVNVPELVTYFCYTYRWSTSSCPKVGALIIYQRELGQLRISSRFRMGRQRYPNVLTFVTVLSNTKPVETTFLNATESEIMAEIAWRVRTNHEVWSAPSEIKSAGYDFRKYLYSQMDNAIVQKASHLESNQKRR